MLKKLRKRKTAKKIWIVLTILIVPAFIFWGFGNFIRSRQENTYAGTIFGKKITSLEYKDAYDAVKTQAIIQFGDNLSEIQKALNLESQAWYRLLLLAEAKKRKITVSDQKVIESIESYPFFKGKDGKFDNDLYSQEVRYGFHTQPRVFEEQTRQNLMLSKLYKEVTKNLSLTKQETKDEYGKSNEQMSIYYIAGIPSDFIKDITVSEEELKDYFTKNSIQFKQPLSFNVEYVYSALDGQNEEIIKDKIKKIMRRLNKKGDFTEVTKDFGLQIKETGLFGQTDPIPGIGWSPQISSLISKLKIGEFSTPIRMDKSYYIMRLKDRREPHIPDFQTIKDKVKEKFIKDKAQEIAKEKIEDCLKKLKELYQANPDLIDFNNIAKIYGLKSDSTNLFKYGSYIEGIGASDIFFTKARGLKEKEFSEIINIPSGFYIIKPKSIIPLDEKKFAEEKDKFASRLLKQKKEEYFSKFVEELKTKAQMF